MIRCRNCGAMTYDGVPCHGCGKINTLMFTCQQCGIQTDKINKISIDGEEKQLCNDCLHRIDI